MEQGNTRSTNQMSNLELGQQAQLHTHPEPCLHPGTVSTYPQPIINHILPVTEPITGFVPHHPSVGHSESPIPYGMTPYNAHHHPHFAPVTTSNYYNPYMNQGPQFIDGFGGAYKSKNAEGYLGNYQNGSSMAGPSSEVRPAPIGGESVLAHNPNHLVHANYQGQTMIAANGPWLDQRFSTNGGNGSTWGWGQAPAIPYMPGSSVNGGGYQETAIHRSSTNFQPYLPTVYPQGHPQSLHHLPQPVQGPFYSQIPVPYRNGSMQANLNPFQVSMELGPGYVGPVPPPGPMVLHLPHGRALVPGMIMTHHAPPLLSILPVDEVAILEIPGYLGVGNTIDHHRDMRMDVDSMSYEELLALGEHMGNVETGLSEDAISSHLETRVYISSTDLSDLDDRETDFCTICQTNYENQEEIGTLGCGHEYHVDCIKKWLILKNNCPICKSSALIPKRKELKIES